MLKLILKDSGGDLRLVSGSFETADWLETATVISLFSDRRADHDEELPAGESDRRGWCLDYTLPNLPDGNEDAIGSKLWMLRREKLTPSTVTRCREYAEEALQWMIDEGAAESVSVRAERQGNRMIAMSVVITREDGRFEWACSIDSETMKPEGW